MLNSGALFSLGWRILPRLPLWLVRHGFEMAGMIAHALNLKPNQQLAKNLTRVTGLKGKPLRKLTRAGWRSYMRYYAEAFQLPRLSRDQLRARVRTINIDPTRKALAHSTVVGALAHLGNWDLAGAWSEDNFAHVITVAEKLEPPQLFEEFLQFRTGLGMEIFPYEKGTGVFKDLLAAAQRETALMPLLTDRDLSRDGMVVRVCGHPIRVAPGPAAISVAADVPFIGVFIRYERLHGQERRRAGSPWGIVIEFTDPLKAPEALGREAKVTWLMERWANDFSRFLQRYPQDWHMLQRCFMADLDPQRLAHAEGGTFGENT